jgi:multidrug efflux pump subunit AcrA (membrane-fusion protein)
MSGVQAAALVSTDASAAWARFARSQDVQATCQSWLALQCAQLPEVRMGLVLWREAERSFVPTAVWPEGSTEVATLGEFARRVIVERQGASERLPGGASSRIAYPLVVDDEAVGVVVVELAIVQPQALQEAMRGLHWGAGWLERLALDHLMRPLQDRSHRLADANDLAVLVLEQREARAASMALCNELARRLEARRVLLGVADRRRRIHAEAISHTAWFDRRNSAINAVENLMEEALDQRKTVTATASGPAGEALNVAHEEYRRTLGLGAVVSVPLAGRDGDVAVLTVEFDPGRTVSTAQLEWLQAVALLSGPALQDKLALRRWWAGRGPQAVSALWERIAGRGHARWKLGAAVLLLGVAVLTLMPWEHRVSARALVEGAEQRAAAAPFKGFVESAPVRAGARVRRGDVLATLDRKDLNLEQVRWQSELEQSEQKYRDALARRERPAIVQLAAQVRQAQAQLALVEEKLARSSIVAPIDGLVVTGDLSQMLGSPVEAGQTLFEVAPADDFRVVLHVDERDIGYVQAGQTGSILLSGRVGEPLAIRVVNVTAVSEVREGINGFRVEASLDARPASLRPGLEGVGKIDAGSRSLGWIWFHPLLDWIRLAAWRWLP